mgnify:FL=1
MIYGYKRPIVGDEEMDKQLMDIEVDELIIETHPYAKKRVQLEELLMKLTMGDRLIVENLVVLADSLHQMVDVLRVADKDDVEITFVEEGITNRTMLTMDLTAMTSFFADLQSKCRGHSTTFGIQEAKGQGKAIGRPKKSNESLQQAFQMYESKKYTLKEIKDVTGISKSTLYRYIDMMGE